MLRRRAYGPIVVRTHFAANPVKIGSTYALYCTIAKATRTRAPCAIEARSGEQAQVVSSSEVRRRLVRKDTAEAGSGSDSNKVRTLGSSIGGGWLLAAVTFGLLQWRGVEIKGGPQPGGSSGFSTTEARRAVLAGLLMLAATQGRDALEMQAACCTTSNRWRTRLFRRPWVRLQAGQVPPRVPRTFAVVLGSEAKKTCPWPSSQRRPGSLAMSPGSPGRSPGWLASWRLPFRSGVQGGRAGEVRSPVARVAGRRRPHSRPRQVGRDMEKPMA